MKYAYIILILAVIAAAGYFVYGRQQTEPVQQESTDTATPAPSLPQETGASEEMSTQSEIDQNARVIKITAHNFAFDTDEIRVKKGDTVTIELTGTEGMHDWVVDEFNAKTDIVREGAQSSVTFVADQAGTFEYYCSVGSHRAMGMVGKLIVEE